VRAYGLIGVAIGTAAAQTLQNTLQLVLGRRKVGIWTHVEASVRPVRELLTAAPRRGRRDRKG
jgi:hypothetical protein